MHCINNQHGGKSGVSFMPWKLNSSFNCYYLKCYFIQKLRKGKSLPRKKSRDKGTPSVSFGEADVSSLGLEKRSSVWEGGSSNQIGNEEAAIFNLYQYQLVPKNTTEQPMVLEKKVMRNVYNFLFSYVIKLHILAVIFRILILLFYYSVARTTVVFYRTRVTNILRHKTFPVKYFCD